MLQFLKKKDDDAAESKVAAALKLASGGGHLPLHEFIPYYCHYNPHTLLTKNGEPLQIIKISSNNLGLNYESGGSEHSVREYIRNAIQSNVAGKSYAFWIHTMRKRKPIAAGSRSQNPFAAHVHEYWQKSHRWKYEYYNEIYVTILHEGQHCELFDARTLKNVWLPKLNRSMRNAFLDSAVAELDGVVSSFLQTIRQNYNAQRLGMVERRPAQSQTSAFYSEPMEFLGEIMNLHTDAFPIREADLSKQLANHALTFGFNAFEAKNTQGNRRFGALLTAKQYHEVTLETADHLLQCPIELVVTQAFSFISHKTALKQYKEQKVMFEISNDGISSTLSGLDDMLRSNRNRPTDFTSQQMSIAVVVDEYRQLEEEVHKVQQSFADMGLIAVREDLKMEECFWAQLPGNFEFIRRKSPVNTGRVAGFSRLNLFPPGNASGNHWGEALAIIPTSVKTPYFFNFHSSDNGHTMVFDCNSFNDQAGHILLYFLLTSAMKYDGRMYLFDHQRSAHLWFDKLSGAYHRFAPGSGHKENARTLRLNPFTLEDSPRNRSFLLAWAATLAPESFALTDAHRDTLQGAIARTYLSPPENRSLEAFIGLAVAADHTLAEAFAAFHGNGEFARLFTGGPERLDLSTALHAFDMDATLRRSACTVPVFAYLMHRIVTSLDGKPTIIVLHDAFDLLENAFFAPRLESLMEMLQQNNAMLLCTTQRPDAEAGKASFATFLQRCGTRLYIPDDVDINYASLVPGLTPHDVRMLLRMSRRKGDFLIKQQSESVGLRVNLDELEDAKSIFAHDIKTLIAAGGKFASIPKAE